MTDRAWTRTGRPRATTMPVAPPAPIERLLVDRGDLVVPLDDARLGRATVGAVLRSLRSIGLDDVAPDVDEAAWRLRRALQRPTAAVTPWLDGLLWRVPRPGAGPRPRIVAALAAALLRGVAVAAAWTLCIVPFLILPFEGLRLVALDGALATVLLLATGIAGCVRALILLLESLEGGANGVRLGTVECVLSVLGILWGSGLTILLAAFQGPTWFSLDAWMAAPAVLALAIAITACVLDDAVPGGARRRRAAPRQSVPRASVLERHDALQAVAAARMADLDPEQSRRLDAAVAAAVRDLHARGQVDASTRDLLLRGAADPGFDTLPTVLLAVDPGARVPVGATVPQGAVRAALVETDVAMRLTTAIPLLGVRLEPSTWHEAPNANAAEHRRQQALRTERDRHVDPIALARTPVLDDRDSRGLRGMLAVVWRVPVWLSAACAIWAALMALVIGLAGEAFTPVSTWITWVMLLLGLAGAVGWALALDGIEAIQRHRSRAALTLWQLAGLIGALAAAVTLGHDRHVDEGLAVLQALTLAAVGVAIVGATVRRIAWWRGREPSPRTPKVGEWPIRLETAHRVDAARREEAAARRAADPEAFDELRARLAALALVPIAQGALDARALDDQHA